MEKTKIQKKIENIVTNGLGYRSQEDIKMKELIDKTGPYDIPEQLQLEFCRMEYDATISNLEKDYFRKCRLIILADLTSKVIKEGRELLKSE
mgnify:CR=1 FL=1